MRLAIIATVLSISLFSASAHAQSAAYAFGPDGPSVFSFGGQLTDQDIKNFENDLNFCDKLRYDAGVPRMSPVADYAVQTCMNARLTSGSHELAPKWRETASMAAQLCATYASTRPTFGPDAYRTYAALGNLSNCLSAELGKRTR
jgi:hypothetical protein